MSEAMPNNPTATIACPMCKKSHVVTASQDVTLTFGGRCDRLVSWPTGHDCDCGATIVLCEYRSIANPIGFPIVTQAYKVNFPAAVPADGKGRQ